MKKRVVMFGVMAAGALAVAGKRTYDLVKLRKAAKDEQEVIDIPVDVVEEDSHFYRGL